MPLNRSRRHLRKAGKCIGGHALDSRTFEPEELRRSRQSCICPIYTDETLNRRFTGQNTDKLRDVPGRRWRTADDPPVS